MKQVIENVTAVDRCLHQDFLGSVPRARQREREREREPPRAEAAAAWPSACEQRCRSRRRRSPGKRVDLQAGAGPGAAQPGSLNFLRIFFLPAARRSAEKPPTVSVEEALQEMESGGERCKRSREVGPGLHSDMDHVSK